MHLIGPRLVFSVVAFSCVIHWCLDSYFSSFSRANRINCHNANIRFIHTAGIDNVNACLTLAKLASSLAVSE